MCYVSAMISATCFPDLDVWIDISLDGFAEGYDTLVFSADGFPAMDNIVGLELTIHQ